MIKRLVRWMMRNKGWPSCHLCDVPTLNLLGDKSTCYGCEHEVMGYDLDHEMRMEANL